MDTSRLHDIATKVLTRLSDFLFSRPTEFPLEDVKKLIAHVSVIGMASPFLRVCFCGCVSAGVFLRRKRAGVTSSLALLLGGFSLHSWRVRCC